MTPAPIECSYPACDYKTPAGCPTWELMTKQLELHASSVHPPPGGGGGHGHVSHKARLESLPRPKFSLNMTEGQWQFINMQWTAYIAQTPASDSQKVEQLRAACDKDLLQRVYDSGSFCVSQKPMASLDQSVARAVGAVRLKERTPFIHCMMISSFDASKAFCSSSDQWNGTLADRRCRKGAMAGAIANV
jgi:hypothetical protein